MAYICEVLNEAQVCVQWATYTEPDLFKSIAITKAQQVELFKALGGVLGAYVLYALFAKAVKIL